MRTPYSKVTWEKHSVVTNVFLLVKEPEPMAEPIEAKLEEKRVSPLTAHIYGKREGSWMDSFSQVEFLPEGVMWSFSWKVGSVYKVTSVGVTELVSQRGLLLMTV